MRALLFSLFGLSLLESIVLLIISDEQISRLVKLIGAAAMTAVILGGIKEFDYHAYAASLQREHWELKWNADSVKTDVEQLHRRYIESQCAAYILDRAQQMQIELSDVSVALEWNTDGYWYPVHAEISVMNKNADLAPLKRMIESELGIPIAEQIWRGEDQSNEAL